MRRFFNSPACGVTTDATQLGDLYRDRSGRSGCSQEADSVCRCRGDAESVESMCAQAGLYSICVDELDRRSPGAWQFPPALISFTSTGRPSDGPGHSRNVYFLFVCLFVFLLRDSTRERPLVSLFCPDCRLADLLLSSADAKRRGGNNDALYAQL